MECTSTLISRSDNVECLAETMEAHPAYPAFETVPMITVPRVARERTNEQKQRSARNRHRAREVRPSMPVMVIPVARSRSDVRTVQTRPVQHRLIAAFVGFVLAAAGCTIAMHAAAQANVTTTAVAR